jgi:dimethylargininase
MKELLFLSLLLFLTLANQCTGQEKIDSDHFISYRLAFVRALSDSFENSLKLAPPPIPIDLDLAKKQHNNYIRLLKGILNEVVELDADPTHPDCNFIEDTAIIIGENAVISRMGAPERCGEEIAVVQAIAHLGTKNITYIESPGSMDGGDILYTGKHLFVGLSRRTNLFALEQLKKNFQGKLTVFGIPVSEGLHLKSILTAFDSNNLVIIDSEVGEKIQHLISQLTDNAYKFIAVPDPVSANVLRIKSTLIIQAGYPDSEAILRQHCIANNLNLVTINMSELIKADGALTCGCILLD